MRCKLTIAYNGTTFLGSQIQKESNNTVFGTLERSLKKLNIDSKTVPSGRTDRGVHAMAQVCHFDLPPFWSDLDKLKNSLQMSLPPSIKIKKIEFVNDAFHARYSAKKRVYRYLIKEGESNPFEDDFITFMPPFNLSEVEKKIKLFCGTHNFKHFMKSDTDTKTTTRIIYRAFTYKHKDYTILNFEANGFLRTQIRYMVAALFSLDEKKIKEQLTCAKKHKLKPAKSNGLYLAKIKYYNDPFFQDQ